MAGDPRASSFDDFYLGTREAVLRQLTAMTLDRELAADSVQEAYARAWQRWDRVSRLEQPAAWVRTVAWRLAVSQFRRRAVAQRALGPLGRASYDVAPAPGIEGGVEVGLDLVAALRSLSADHRRVLVLREMVGLSVREVAEEVGVPEGTVKSRLARARERLLAELGPGYLDGADPGGAPTLVGEEQR